MGIRGELFSLKLVCEERTYFFNVKENRLGDVFLSVVESKESELSSYERHSIVVFQENLDEFMGELTKIAGQMKKVKPARPSDKFKAGSRESGSGNAQGREARSGGFRDRASKPGESRDRTDHAPARRSFARSSEGGSSERSASRTRPAPARAGGASSRESPAGTQRKRPVVRARKPTDKDGGSES